MSQTDEQVVELDDAALKAIAEQVTKSITPTEIDYDKVAEKMAEIANKSDKELNKLKGAAKASEGEVLNKYDKMSKEAFAVAQLNAVMQKDTAELHNLNKHALNTLQKAGYIEKATYLNVGTTADGGALIPNADLLTDIFTTLSDYSSVANLPRVINLTDGSSLDVATLTADVIMTEVGSEGGTKPVTKPTLGDGNVAVREFAGIALLTKKLVRQSAIDIYAVLRDSFARAIAKKREELILTDSTSGIVTKSGVVVMNAGGGTTSGKDTVAEISVAELKSMPFQVPVASAQGGSYVFSRLLLGSLAGREDTTGQPVITLNPGQQGGALSGTFNGYPFVVAETLGTSDAVSTVHAVFGNWKQYAILLRQGAVDSQVFDSGTVTDGSAVVHNLIQENKLAMRVEMWENVGYPLPGAFVRLRTSAS